MGKRKRGKLPKAMGHLHRPRKGWENERLASYLLSRFSFVAHPASIADELGSDFFCTIFQVQDNSGPAFLVPRRSFAIQVKSDRRPLNVDNKIDYLDRLELPFLLGVVRQSPAEMDIYSADLLPLLFSHHGRPNQLLLRPVTGCEFDPNAYYEDIGQGRLRLRCPLVTTLSASDTQGTLTPKVGALLQLCGRAQSNIAARVSQEHIYNVDDSGRCQILAGPGSVQVFRENFVKRLAEVFFNLEWTLANKPGEFKREEFDVFEKLCSGLHRLNRYAHLLRLASERCESLRGKLNKRSAERSR